MNYPTNSNISDTALADRQALGTTYIRPQTITLHGSDLMTATESLETAYEYLDDRGCVADLPLAQSEIAEVLAVWLYAKCEMYLSDIQDYSRDPMLKQMIERKVQLKQAA